MADVKILKIIDDMSDYVDSHNAGPLSRDKIMISKDETMEFGKINALTQKIYDLAKESNKIEVVRTLKEIVKEFKSNNSVYQQLD